MMGAVRPAGDVSDIVATTGTGVREKKDVVAELRGRIARIGGAVPTAAPAAPAPASEPASPSTGVESATGSFASTVAVPGWLGQHLVSGGLPRGAVTVAQDCPAALVDLLAVLTATGGCAAVVGHPRLALAAVAAAGGDLDRLVVVPDPAPHATAVLGTLVDGLDLVLYRPPQAVAPTAARPVEARLRRGDCALLVCGDQQSWPTARLHLQWQTGEVTGLGRGSGRVREVTVAGKLWGQGQPPQTFTAAVGGADSTATAPVSTAPLSTVPQERAL